MADTSTGISAFQFAQLAIGFFGGGFLGFWVRWFVDDRRRKREAYHMLYRGFLSPLQERLRQNRNDFERLQVALGPEIHRLEYTPSKLRDQFNRLKPGDPLRVSWRLYVDRIIDNNAACEKLILENQGDARLSTAMRDEFPKLLDHFRDWRTGWQFALGEGASIAETNEQLIADPFPEKADAVIEAECKLARRLGGIER